MNWQHLPEPLAEALALHEWRVLLLDFTGGELAGNVVQAPLASNIRSLGSVEACKQIDGRYDMAILSTTWEDLGGADIQHLLAELRNVHSNRIELLLAPAKQGTERSSQLKTLLALGFRQAGGCADDNAQGNWYRYDLAHYNRKRAWNSPENWANPQNFHRFRW